MPAVEQLFKSYNWPGNLRELKNVINRAALLTETENIDLIALPFEIVNHGKLLFEGSSFLSKDSIIPDDSFIHTDRNITQSNPSEINEYSLKVASIDAEYETIVMALKKANYNKSKAAKILNIDRKTLYNKMKEYKEFNDG